MSERKPIYLVDGSGYIFRAYFAVRRLSTSSGLPTNAVFGFTTMLLKLLRDFEPEHIAMVFDTKAPTFRHQMYPDYKAHRPPPPEDLVPQFDLIRRAVEALAIPVLSLEGYEADDLLGTLARQAVEAGHAVVILTGDKDLMQLVDDRVQIYDGMKNKHIGRAEVEERFGVPPERVIDVLALAGDSSDNVPGVQGIGEKTAAKLVQEYGDLDAILAAAPSIKQKGRREKLIAQADQARLSRDLVTLALDAPVTLDLEAMRYTGPDLDASRALFGELEFHRLLREPPFAGGPADVSAAPASPAEPGQVGLALGSSVDRSAYRAVTELAALDEVIGRCRAAGRFALDTETDSLDPMRARLVGVSLAWADGQAAYIPCGHSTEAVPTQLSVAQLIERLGPLLADPTLVKVAQNGKYDRTVLLQHGFAAFELGGDPMLASYLLDAGENSHGLDALAQRHLGHENIHFEDVCGKGKNQISFAEVPLEQAVAYAAEDADVTLRLEKLLRPKLEAARLVQLYDELELPLERVLCDIERNGVLIDTARLERMGEEMKTDLARIAARCEELAGHPFNLASPKQVAKVLFEELALPVIKKTKTGASTDAGVLEALIDRHELPRQLLEHRTVASSRAPTSTCCRAWSTPRPGGCTPSSTRPWPPPGGCRARTPTCRTSRCAPPRGGASARPSWPGPTGCCWRPTTRRSSCASSPTSARTRASSRRFWPVRTSTPAPPARCLTRPSTRSAGSNAARPRRSTSACSTAWGRSGSRSSSASRTRRPSSTWRRTSSATPGSAGGTIAPCRRLTPPARSRPCSVAGGCCASWPAATTTCAPRPSGWPSTRPSRGPLQTSSSAPCSTPRRPWANAARRRG